MESDVGVHGEFVAGHGAQSGQFGGEVDKFIMEVSGATGRRARLLRLNGLAQVDQVSLFAVAPWPRQAPADDAG